MIVEQEVRLDGTSVLHGINLNLVPILGDRTQRSLLTVDLHVSDLRVRHSQRLCEMLNRLPSVKIHAQALFPLIGRQEIFQSPNKQEVRPTHKKIIFLIAGPVPA